MITSEAHPRLAELRFLVVGLARDCEQTVSLDISRLHEALRFCKSLAWLVIESDSSDRTVDALHILEKDVMNFRFISMGSLQEAIPERTERIAHCRNVYLRELNSNPLYSEVDYVVIADLDGVNSLITTDGFLSCLTRAGWDVCTANQRGPYYDIWALRHPIWNPGDCWKQYRFLIAHKALRETAIWTGIYGKMITLDETGDWVEVDSAFGGLAIYRKSALEGTQYYGLDEDGDGFCEHVSLHNQLRSKGFRIYINPRLINSADTIQSHERSFKQILNRLYLDLRHQIKFTIVNLLRLAKSK